VRIGILSQYFHPEPVVKVNRLALGLTAAGHTVEVLTAIPSWGRGQFYNGYKRKLIQEEWLGEIRVVRTIIWPYLGRVIWKRMLSYGSFGISALLGSARIDRLDVLYVYHPPLTISLPAYLVSRQQKVPFIYDVQDIWPEAGVAAGAVRPGILYKVMLAVARRVYILAEHVTVIAPEFRDVLVEQGVSPEKISVVPNWADESIYKPQRALTIRQQYGLPEDGFLVMYAGTLGSTHGVEYILEAARLLKKEEKIFFVFAGSGPEYEKMVQTKEQLGLKNVKFLGFIEPIQRLSDLVCTGDLMLVHMRRSMSGAVSLPSRMLAYMACARPVLVASQGAPRRLVEKALCGAVCEPEDPCEMANTIVDLYRQPSRLEEMGRRGRETYLSEFSERVVLDRLIKLIERVGNHGSTK